MINWILFLLATVFAYIFISLFAQLTGGEKTETPLQAALNVFGVYAFLALIIGNVLFALAIFYGFRVSPNTLPMAIAKQIKSDII